MPTRVTLFGDKTDEIRKEFDKYSELSIEDQDPDLVVCYGGDGTLLSAEIQWPGIPKVPIRNSRRGNRCIAHPAPRVIERLARGQLIRTEYMKLQCVLTRAGAAAPCPRIVAMNEVNVHMGRINSAVRFRLWLDDEAYGADEDREIIGDGFLISTPFGSTAYFNHLTQGVFHTGLGIAFKATTEATDHLVVHEDVTIRVLITRGPAVLGYDNCPDYINLREGDQLLTHKHDRPAVIFTWSPMKHQSDAF